MSKLLARILGRIPIGWLQLTHSRSRLASAIAGVAFANILVFVQLGILGALNSTITSTYELFDADIMVSAQDAHTINDGGNVARQRLFQALAVDGVESGAPLFLGNASWARSDGSEVKFVVLGIDPTLPMSANAAITDQVAQLLVPGTALIDVLSRGVDPGALEGLSPESPLEFELNRKRMRAVGTVRVGGGFASDGLLIVSDQTFLRMFPQRRSGAPDHLLIRLAPGAQALAVIPQIKQMYAPAGLRVRTLDEAAREDQVYQTTRRPTGLIFGFGVIMGVIVGVIIVYQILSTDVAEHLREYATFKAMGYGSTFFVGVVLEEAILLAILGFVPGFTLSMLIYKGLAAKTGLPLAMSFMRAAVVLMGTVTASALSGALATRKLSSSDPADLF